MSFEYDRYLRQHREAVAEAYYWIRDHIPELLVESEKYHYEHQICYDHDTSKDRWDEYSAYDAYFYGGNRSYAVCENFKVAWLTHIHRNSHHWQHWILVNDDPNEGEVIMDMPYNYIVEMVCDWMSFGIINKDLSTTLDWYKEHAGYIKMSDNTRREVERILQKIKEKVPDMDVKVPITNAE